MRGSRRTRLVAAVGFLIIAVLLIGGMAWATVATVELATRNVQEEHLRNVRWAVSEMDRYVSGVLESEVARPYTDYLAFHAAEPEVVWAGDGTELQEADLVVLKSPITEAGPPHDWIDLYFQVDEDGAWTSPQVPLPRDVPGWVVDSLPEASPVYRAHSTLSWLESALPVAELWNRVDEAAERERLSASGQNEAPKREAVQGARSAGPKHAHPHPPVISDYQRRSQSNIAAQRSSLPSDQCVHVRLVDYHLVEQRVRGFSVREQALYACSEPVFVGISPVPMTSLWLGIREEGRPKLAFVRSGYEDNKRVHQGFVADWSRLKAALLARIGPWFARADLQPVADDMSVDPAVSATAMSSMPARLVVPDIPGGASAAAWRSVRGVLFTTWTVAAAALALAGWGLRNLVALTERRMQFAYAVTHELRTPLTTFRLYSDMLSAGLVPEESKPEYFDTLNRESVRLSGLVEGVLEYARLDNHKVQLNPSDTDAPALLAALSEELDKRCTENGVEARTRNQVPNGQGLWTDVDLVSQIAGVLINNACRHARGADKPAVVVELSADNSCLHLDVIDTGPGIDRADARTIFKPFRRGRRAASTAQAGIGLGLALARSWAGLLGGRLDLVARHHAQFGGAHFRLTLPAQLHA